MMKYEVDYNFIINSRGEKIYMENQIGFETQEAAETWAKENTVDGVVSWYKEWR